MTARPFWDPVTGAAIAHLGLPILPGLPCPTCGGKRWRRAPAPWDEVLPGRPCPDCTDGVWTPPDSPVPIGVTSARPEVGRIGDVLICSVVPKGYVPDYETDDDFDEAPGRGLMTNDEWAHKFDDISNHNPPHPIVLSSMIGEGTLRKVKVVDSLPDGDDVADGYRCVSVSTPEGRGPVAATYRWDAAARAWWADPCSSALPFLPGLKPGDTVYLLDGFTESMECPECGGAGRAGDLRCNRCGASASLPLGMSCAEHNPVRPLCSRCAATGRLSCPFPVDAPDHPCVQP